MTAMGLTTPARTNTLVPYSMLIQQLIISFRQMERITTSGRDAPSSYIQPHHKVSFPTYNTLDNSEISHISFPSSVLTRVIQGN